MHGVIRFVFLLAAMPAAVAGTVLASRAVQQTQRTEAQAERLHGSALFLRAHLDRIHPFHAALQSWIWVFCALAILALVVVAYAWITSFHPVMQWIGVAAAATAIAALLCVMLPAGDAYGYQVTCFHSRLDPCPLPVSADNAAWAVGYLGYAALVTSLAVGQFLSQRSRMQEQALAAALRQAEAEHWETEPSAGL